MDIDVRVTQLLCSRLCHDLVGAVSAVNTGIEFMTDGDVSSEALDECARVLRTGEPVMLLLGNKKSFISGLDRDRSRHPERLFGRPDMFLIRTPRARSNAHGFGMIFPRYLYSQASASNVVAFLPKQNRSHFDTKSDPGPGVVLFTKSILD